ncbi:nmrA-like family protein [Cladophialophora carrionii]|uniref:NmrA-like family protein n=1 Tax=Cladophialophora carrionii TaxID=86049 RepID=A0A1C1CZ70_9EURO|nr:nmrA-like family protein [Cladophialophora carrionii]
MSANHFKNVTVFGAGGTNIGHHIVKALSSKPDLFTVTILARRSSKSTFPAGVQVKYIDDPLPHDELVTALQGQDVVISAIGFGAIALERKLIDAAADAHVKRFFPSEYGVNNTHAAARALCPVFEAKGAIIDYLAEKHRVAAPHLTWTAVPTGLWLDWALEPAVAFAGIDITHHTAALWAGGEHRLSWSTLPWAAEGIKQMLIAPPEVTANKVMPLHGFLASQNEIVALLEEIQGVKYAISRLDEGVVIAAARQSWDANKDVKSALDLVKAGFFLDGYGSDLVGGGLRRWGMMSWTCCR